MNLTTVLKQIVTVFFNFIVLSFMSAFSMVRRNIIRWKISLCFFFEIVCFFGPYFVASPGSFLYVCVLFIYQTGRRWLVVGRMPRQVRLVPGQLRGTQGLISTTNRSNQLFQPESSHGEKTGRILFNHEMPFVINISPIIFCTSCTQCVMSRNDGQFIIVFKSACEAIRLVLSSLNLNWKLLFIALISVFVYIHF